MATSVLMASEEATRRGSEKNHRGFAESSRSEKAKEGGRRKSKLNNDGAQKVKKQRQRGMGVAQLERLRMQESSSSTTNNNQSPLLHYSLNLRTLPQDRYLLPSSFPDPMQAAVPEPLSKFVGNASGYGLMMNGVVGQSGLNHNLLINHQGIGNGGFSGGLVGGYGTVNGNVGADLYGLGRASSTRWCLQAAGNVVGETSKELSSIPNTNKYFSDNHCDLCHKKKKPLNGMRDLYGNAYPINSPGFLGFNLGGNQNTDSTFGSGYGGGSEDKNGAHVAVQRNGGSVFMEYEFFPAGKGGTGTCSKELEEELLELGSSSSSSEASVVAVAVGRGEAPNCSTTTTTATTTCTGFDASNSIDLSLKLSY